MNHIQKDLNEFKREQREFIKQQQESSRRNDEFQAFMMKMLQNGNMSNDGKMGASTSNSLPSNTIPNPRGEMKAITTRSGLAYEGPTIPTNSSTEEVVEEDVLGVTKDIGENNTSYVQPPVIPNVAPEPVVQTSKVKIPYPSRLNDEKLREKAMNQVEKFFQILQDMNLI